MQGQRRNLLLRATPTCTVPVSSRRAPVASPSPRHRSTTCRRAISEGFELERGTFTPYREAWRSSLGYSYDNALHLVQQGDGPRARPPETAITPSQAAGLGFNDARLRRWRREGQQGGPDCLGRHQYLVCNWVPLGVTRFNGRSSTTPWGLEHPAELARQQLPNAPHNKIAINVLYDFKMETGSLTPSIGPSWRDDAYGTLFTPSTGPRRSGGGICMTWKSTNGRYEVIAFGKNVFNTIGYDQGAISNRLNFDHQRHRSGRAIPPSATSRASTVRPASTPTSLLRPAGHPDHPIRDSRPAPTGSSRGTSSSGGLVANLATPA